MLAQGTRTMLVVEDDPHLHQLYRDCAQQLKLEVLITERIAGVFDLVEEHEPAALVLDIELPDGDSLEILPQLHQQFPQLPIVVVSGFIDLEQRLKSFKGGAVDFVPKPFFPQELMLRIDRCLSILPTRGCDDRLSGGALTIDEDAFKAWSNGKEVKMRRKLWDLALLFLRNPGRLFTHEQLNDLVWECQFVSNNTVHVHINQLRKLMEHDPKKPRYLLTVKGFGYRFNPKGV